MVEDRLSLFLEELEKQGVEIAGDTAIVCNDSVVLFTPNERGAVDIAVVTTVKKVDYNLSITEAELELWNTTTGIMQELGGSDGNT